MLFRTNAAVFLGVSMLALATQAFAQEVATPPKADATAAPEEQAHDNSDDIVVTANKREQNLNDVGLTVTAIGADELKEKRISDIADIAQSVPGFSFANSVNGTPIYTLRGVGFIEASLGAYPTVSTYVDEVPLPFPALSSHAIYDLERVEVLKGPQGTLFGQNATGGALNIIAAKPTDDFIGGVDLSYGRFNQMEAEGFVSGPLSDTLRARAAVRVERGDGWQQSNSRPGDTNGKTRNYMGRLLLEFEPSDGARFLLNVNGWVDKSDTQAPQYIGNQPQAPLPPIVANAPFSPFKPRAADWTPGIPFRDNNFWQASLRGDIDVTDDITLTSISAFSHYDQRQGNDGDGLLATAVDLPLDIGKIKSYSQELRLANDPLSAFRWTVGANYEKSSVFQETGGNYTDTSVALQLGGLGFNTFGFLTYTNDQDFRNYAFFGNVEFDVAANVTIKAGARYTNSKTEASLFSVAPAGDLTGTGAFFYAALLGGAFGPYNGQPYSINNLGETINGTAPGAPGIFTGAQSEDNISYRLGVDWKLDPDILFYANVSKGYKAGSFPAVSASVFSQYLPVTQESLMAYEAGLKATLLDGKFQFNGAAFYYDYKDKQLRSKTIEPIFGLLDVLQNIPKSSIKGFEFDATIRPADFFTVTTAFTYLDAKIDEFEGINAGGLTADFSGARMPFTPKYQVGVSANLDIPISANMNLFSGASLSFRSDTVAAIGGDENPTNAVPQSFKLFGIDDYATLDAHIGIKSSDDIWRLSIWAENITNTYYWNNAVIYTDTITRYAGKPATYGVAVSYNF